MLLLCPAIARPVLLSSSRVAAIKIYISYKGVAFLQSPKDGEASKGPNDVKVVQLDKELTLEERQLIVKHALATEDQDAEGLLNNIRARMER